MPSLLPIQGLKGAAPQPTDSSGDDHEMFQPAENGPFQCGHCEYFTSPNQCAEQHMIQKYGDEGGFTTAGGQVSDGACCDYYESVDEGQATPSSLTK